MPDRPAAPGASPRVFALGLDGATFDLLEPWFAEGKLPTLARLYREGTRARLQSVVPYLSPQAWTSFMTGKNPGKHAVWDFIVHLPDSYEIQFANAASRRAVSLWKMLGDAGKKVCVVNVPMTFPPEPVNGYLISGMEAPGVFANFAYPPDLYARMKRELGGYNMHGDYWIQGTPEEYLTRLHGTIADQAEAVRWLLRQEPWDFFMMVFGSTDRVQHHFWAQMDATHPRHDPQAPAAHRSAIYDVYARLDDEIARFLEALPPDTVVLVMSDHGAGPYHKIVYLDRWLESQGFLHYKLPAHSAAWNPARWMFHATEEFYLRLRSALPRGVKDWLKSNLPTARRVVESYLLTSSIDWEKTTAFSLGIESTRIFVNRDGRFPHGFVKAGAEYDAVIARLKDGLLALRDPDTGEPLVENVYHASELYSGPYLAEAADLVVQWKGDLYITRRSYGPEDADRIVDDNLMVGEVGRLMSIPQTGTHRRDGIFLLHGPGVAANCDLGEVGIMDLAPTLLFLLGQPVPEDMDGHVVTAAFSEAFHAARGAVQFRPGTGWDAGSGDLWTPAEDEAAVRERLRGLGYIE